MQHSAHKSNLVVRDPQRYNTYKIITLPKHLMTAAQQQKNQSDRHLFAQPVAARAVVGSGAMHGKKLIQTI